MSTHTRLMLALNAIRLRCRGTLYDLQADVITICEDALRGLSIDRSPEEEQLHDPSHFDHVRVDGEAGFEVEIRHVKPDHRSKKETP